MPVRSMRAENPRRLTQMLVAIRKDLFRLNQSEMADKLLEKIRRKEDNEPALQITKTTVNNLEHGETGFKFTHIEAYARAVGVPSGILLLVSLYSQTTDPERDIGELKRLLQLFLRVCDDAQLRRRSLRVQDLERLHAAAWTEPEWREDETDLDRLLRMKSSHEKHGGDPLKGEPLFDRVRKT